MSDRFFSIRQSNESADQFPQFGISNPVNDHPASMKNYQADISLGAPVARSYEALTTQRGLRGWWTASCEVGTAVGERIAIRFGTTFKVMRIEELQQDSRVRWKVIEAHLDVPGLSRADDWVGTEIVFQLLRESNAATRLRIEHIGLTPEVGCFEICSQGWRQFLASFKSYVETGMGAPYADHAPVQKAP
jgi:uncharacterized protein YndB with AHSA1/START domain